MDTVKISKNEYKRLVSKAKAYDKIAEKFFENIIEDPIDIVVKDFKKTNSYSNGFLSDLESGLRKSSYAKRKK